MSYMAHLRAVALVGVALIVEKTRTYGPSWKKRGGAGAWFTTVRPWDRLESIVDQYGGDVFAAVAADPLGRDGSALGCLRDIRNYTILIEAEMVARGNVNDPLPEEGWSKDVPKTMPEALDHFFKSYMPGQPIERVDMMSPPERGHLVTQLIVTLGLPKDVSELKRVTDLANAASDLVAATPAYVNQDEAHSARLGAGQITADGDHYTVLDIGHGRDLWSVGLGALSGTGPKDARIHLDQHIRSFAKSISGGELPLIASRELVSGGHQIIVNIARRSAVATTNGATD